MNNQARCLLLKILPCLLLLPWTAASAESITLELKLAAAGTFYVEGVLDEQVDTQFLVDTGSGYVSLSQQTFARLGSSSSRQLLRHIQGVMANGKKVIVPVYQIAELRLGVSCVLHDIEVAVMPSGSTDILGLNAIRQLQPVTLSLAPPSLTGNCLI